MSTISFTPITGPTPTVNGGSSGSGGSNISFTPIDGAPTTATAPAAPAPTGATGNEGPLAATGNVLKNLIPSAVNFAVGAVKTPIQGLKDLTQIPGEVAALWKGNTVVEPSGQTVQQGGGPTSLIRAVAELPEAGTKTLIPKAVQDALGGNFQGASADIQNDPVGNIAPIVLAGSVAAHGFSPEAGAAFDEGVSKIAAPVTDTASAVGAPLSAAARGIGNLAAGAVRYGVKGLTGLDANTIAQVIAHPEQYTPEAMAETTRESVAQEVKNALDARETALGDSGTKYAPIRGSADMIDVSSPRVGTAADFQNIIEKNTGLKMDEDGQFAPTATSRVDAPTDIAKVQRIYDAWQPYFEQGAMTANEFLTLRSKLATVANYEGIGKSSSLESAASGMRSDLNTTYRDQIPGLGDLDAEQTAMRSDNKRLEKGLLDNDGNLRDSDINKIANATGKSRAILLKQLEELVPGISDKLNALRAVEDIRDTSERHKVGTYTKALTGGLTLGGIVTANVPLIVSGITEAIISNPKVAIPLLRAYSFSREITAGVVANLASVAKAGNELPNGEQNSFGALTPKMQELTAKGGGAVKSYFEKKGIRLAPSP